MRLNDLKPNKGAKHRRKRLGCGESSGLGKTSGRGHKGQKSRAGSSGYLGFEGGQMPIYRRLPTRGFNNARFTENVAIVNVCQLEAYFDADAEVTEASLRDFGLVKGTCDSIKILGGGELTKALQVNVAKISASAAEKIEKAGGSIKSSK